MKVLSNLDLNRNQLLNGVLHNLAGSDPATPVEGQIFRDTTNHVTKIYGASGWETLTISTHTHAYIPLATLTEQGDIMYASGAGAVAALAHGAAGQVLQSGGNAANPSWLTLGTMAAAAATDYIAKALLTEQGDILYASAAATPAALPHGNAGQVLQSGGNAANPSWLTLGTMAAATATDYIAKAVGTAHGDLLYFSASATPAVLAHGTDAQVLTAHTDGSLTWESPAAGHTQNTDTGTTGTNFEIDSDATAVALYNTAGVLEVKVHGGATYADLKAKNITCDVLTVNTTVTIEAETVTLHDNILLLDENAATAGASSGIQVERGSTGADASLLWVEADSAWKAGLAGAEIKVARVYTCDVGDNDATVIQVTHNLGTRDVNVSLVTKASTYDAVMTDWVADTVNTVTFTFAVKPTSAQYRAVIVG